jgi:hypothetical protein
VGDDKYYDISFDLNITSPRKIAHIFCSQKATELQISTDDSLANCVTVIEGYIGDKLIQVDPSLAANNRAAVNIADNQKQPTAEQEQQQHQQAAPADSTVVETPEELMVV